MKGIHPRLVIWELNKQQWFWDQEAQNEIPSIAEIDFKNIGSNPGKKHSNLHKKTPPVSGSHRFHRCASTPTGTAVGSQEPPPRWSRGQRRGSTPSPPATEATQTDHCVGPPVWRFCFRVWVALSGRLAVSVKCGAFARLAPSATV